MKTDQGDSKMYTVFLLLARWDCVSNSHSGFYIFTFVQCTYFVTLIEVSKWANFPLKKSKKSLQKKNMRIGLSGTALPCAKEK